MEYEQFEEEVAIPVHIGEGWLSNHPRHVRFLIDNEPPRDWGYF